MLNKKCTGCNITYYSPKKYFHKNKTQKDGLCSICKKCKKEERKYYYQIKKSKKEVFERICEYKKCQKPFTTTDSRKKYCCYKCSWSAVHYKNDIEDYKAKRNFKARYERAKEVAPLNNKRWSEEDILYLVEKRVEGLKFKDIGIVLGRKAVMCGRKYNEVLKTNKLKGK